MKINVLFTEIQAGIAVLIILLMRPGMRKLPKVYSYMLWLVVFARLLVPVSFESRFSVMPSAVESGVWLEENFGWTGMTDGGEDADGIVKNDAETDTEAVGSGLTGGGNVGIMGENSPVGTGFPANGNNENAGMAGADSSVNISHRDENLETGNDSIRHMTAQGTDLSADSMMEGGVKTDFAIEGDKGIGKGDLPQSGGNEVHGKRRLPTLWETVLLILWAAGAAVILAYNGMALILVKRRINKAERLRENIFISSQVKSPFTMGVVRPKIYLPSDLPEAEQEYIICHETVHIRRKDYLVKNMAFLLTALHWFNPFVWVAFNYMGRDMEMSCDEKVIGEMGEEIKKQYSQSLLNFAQGRCPAAMTPITFGENSVKQRVSNVLTYKSASRWAAVLGAVILFAAAGMAFTVRSNAGQDQQGSGSVSTTDPETRISAKSSSLAVRDAGASPEIIQAGFLLARKSPYGALDCWARAFTDRNGDMLYQLAADEEGFINWERVVQRGDGSFAFGESSPWPWEYDYGILMSPEDSTAEITFHMRTSVPEIYVVREKVRITESAGLYYVDHEDTWDNYRIDTGQEYEEAYGHDADNGYAEMAVLYDDAFYRAILTQLLNGDNPGFYLKYTDPVTAAKDLLHLGAGEGEVTEWHMVSATQLRSAGTEFPEWASMPAPDWLMASSASGVGSRVLVTYTFAKDGSQAEILMELKEESQGIWGLAGGGIREVYDMVWEPEMMEHGEGKADLSYVIELSNYGIYRLGAHSGLTCLWAGDVGQEAVARFSDNRLYLFQSLERAEENSADGMEVVFVYDLLTGELYREHLAIPQDYQRIFPEVDLGVDGGFVQIYGFGSKAYTLPLENLQEPLWNQKTFQQMSKEDKQAYGVDNRTYLLNHPDTLVQLSIRETERTSAFIDLDGDGVSEQVILSADPDEKGQYWEYDSYRLAVCADKGGMTESAVRGSGARVYNDIWAYSPDGEKIILVLYEDGASGDPRTCLYGYEEGELKALGEFHDDIRTCTMEDGVISGRERCDVIQTDAIHTSWRFGDSGKLEMVPQKVYDFVALNEIELLEELPVQNILPPGEEGIYFGIRYFTISPQTVRFLQTDSTFSWIYVEAADGSRGWFQMDGGKVKELGKDSSEVFGGMYYGEGF